MKTVGAYEAKTRLSAILDEVEKGEQITITKNGRPVAVIQPVSGGTGDIHAVIDALRNFGRERHLGHLSIRDLIDEGRD